MILFDELLGRAGQHISTVSTNDAYKRERTWIVSNSPSTRFIRVSQEGIAGVFLRPQVSTPGLLVTRPQYKFGRQRYAAGVAPDQLG